VSDGSACVFIVDDDEAVRDALGFLMQSVGLLAKSFASADNFLSVFDDSQPGCLVSDIRMPGMSGLDLQETLIQRGSVIPMIFITGHGDIPMAVEAIKKGAHDFLTKPFRDQDLLDCINSAMEKDTRQRKQQGQRACVERRVACLSKREKQVLDLVVAGTSNKEIANELNLSHRTVEVHRSHMMEKMETRSLAELVSLMQWIQ
jgi:two-component system, LuxR family, response regulator FixJ